MRADVQKPDLRLTVPDESANDDEALSIKDAGGKALLGKRRHCLVLTRRSRIETIANAARPISTRVRELGYWCDPSLG
jgi:hypothetical protein